MLKFNHNGKKINDAIGMSEEEFDKLGDRCQELHLQVMDDKNSKFSERVEILHNSDFTREELCVYHVMVTKSIIEKAEEAINASKKLAMLAISASKFSNKEQEEGDN